MPDQFTPLAALDPTEAGSLFQDMLMDLLDPLSGVTVSDVLVSPPTETADGFMQATVRVPMGGLGPVGEDGQ